MSAVSTSTSAFVQQSFAWADSDTNNDNVVATVSTPIVRRRNQPSNRNANVARVTVPHFESTTSARRGRCEHVGGIMGAVLEKYGITLDQFLAELANTPEE